MFLIEGSDDAGKTTMAKKVVEYFHKNLNSRPVHYAHMSRPGPGFNFGSHYLLTANPFAVQDRFHMGGIVYHTDFNFNQRRTAQQQALSSQPDHLSEHWMRTVDAVLALQGSFVMLMTVDPVLYAERLKEKPKEEMFSFDENVKFNDKWRRLARGACHYSPKIDWNFQATRERPYPTDQDLEEVCSDWFQRMLFVETQAGHRILNQILLPTR